MRRVLIALLSVLIVAALWICRPGSPLDVEISQGERARDVARALSSQGVILSSSVFRGLAKAAQLDKDIKPGIYHLRRNMSEAEALWRLTHDKNVSIKISIPEGWDAKQIAERLEANGIVPAADFLAVARQNSWEGYLFPTTYFLNRGMAAADVAKRMRQEFARQAEPVIHSKPSRLSPEGIVTLASIVEREAVLPQERPMIASVYINRLIKRMPLGADPTVQYALGYWKKGLTHADLKTDSPYNTYIHQGLPPGPICSPGLDSIRAVLEPAKTDALYFVANNTGGHTFTETFDQHLKAKSQAARERRKAAALKQATAE